ncbi:MAG: hypothetical protein FJ290_14790 [Planctomycetes bacterium]|nr:hypothetical protein [Planctomycetota bacterium]
MVETVQADLGSRYGVLAFSLGLLLGGKPGPRLGHGCPGAGLGLVWWGTGENCGRPSWMWDGAAPDVRAVGLSMRPILEIGM